MKTTGDREKRWPEDDPEAKDSLEATLCSLIALVQSFGLRKNAFGSCSSSFHLRYDLDETPHSVVRTGRGRNLGLLLPQQKAALSEKVPEECQGRDN